jgi:hypothetical protein
MQLKNKTANFCFMELCICGIYLFQDMLAFFFLHSFERASNLIIVHNALYPEQEILKWTVSPETCILERHTGTHIRRRRHTYVLYSMFVLPAFLLCKKSGSLGVSSQIFLLTSQ